MIVSEPVYPEDALPQNDPNPEGEDVDPDFVSEQEAVVDADTEWDEEDAEDLS
ncbi:hypothetical protein [Microbacterium abyssi]|uniref:hypothetical protein n=1 Tax=Microbacterium abyssi TaxID=2782166 RepID=UPI001887A1ED|nr:hypothetical protein [Microbacterium sp. A18JL241]